MPTLKELSTPQRLHTSFRVMRESLDPDFLTEYFEMQASTSTRKGDPTIFGLPIKRGEWILNTKFLLSTNLQEHLDTLLNLINPKKTLILNLHEQGYHLSISCYGFSEQDNVECHVNFETLQMMAELKCNFWFDIYFDSGEELEEEEEGGTG